MPSAFRNTEKDTVMNLNYKRDCWVLLGMKHAFICRLGSWTTNCPDLGETKIAGVARNTRSTEAESPATKYLEQVKCFHDTDCNERLHLHEEWDMGTVSGNLQEKDESLGMGLRQD